MYKYTNYSKTYMYHLTDPTHGWDMGGVRMVYIGSAADGVLVYKQFNILSACKRFVAHHSNLTSF